MRLVPLLTISVAAEQFDRCAKELSEKTHELEARMRDRLRKRQSKPPTEEFVVFQKLMAMDDKYAWQELSVQLERLKREREMIEGPPIEKRGPKSGLMRNKKGLYARR